MYITYDDGKKEKYPYGTRIIDIITSRKELSQKGIVAAILDTETVDLHFPLEKDASLQFLTADAAEGLRIFWHSSSHILAHAIKLLYPDAILGIGPSISNGFYYDILMADRLNEDHFPMIEKKMQEIIDADLTFEKRTVTKIDALKLFESRGETFKSELIQEIPDDSVSIYQNGDFVDLCRGPHVSSTGMIQYFKLLSVAGAYWHGDERNAVLQRIYGVSFPRKEMLENHLKTLEEAQKRDHRKLGRELDLFSFQNEGPGFPFWHHNGMILYSEIMTYMRQTLLRKGYEEVKTPIILSKELWLRSGHWDHYKENMYFTEIDEAEYAIKPMNCPGSLLIFNHSQHSYRDLPLKMSEMGLVHRHEKSGVLHGLFRVRQFTQDDAHVFCTPEQMEGEIVQLIELVDEVYRTFGYTDFQVELSTKPQKCIGTAADWAKAETALKNALQSKNRAYQVNPGEGAFYGPKIDYHIRDSLGRLWQCGTIQVDFCMPERFQLEYVGPDGAKHRPVMIHRAILGSVERFIGILIEHTGGAFPLWLAPVQVMIIPVSEKHLETGKSVMTKLRECSIRCRLDDRSEKLGYKIRDAEVKKIPYMCVIGDKEKDGTLSVRKRHEGDQGSMEFTALVQRLHDEMTRRTGH